jgi:hypothetical protein
LIGNKYMFLKQEEWYAYFQAAKSSIPHFKKRAKGGEDASFESEKYYFLKLVFLLSQME